MTTQTITQTGLTPLYLQTLTSTTDQLNHILLQKVDIDNFNSLRDDLQKLHTSFLDGSLEEEKQRLEDDGTIEIDHHDEYVLGRLALTDERVAILTSRVDALEQKHLNFEQGLLDRMKRIETNITTNETNIQATQTITTKLSQDRINPLENHVIDILARLSNLHDDHHEHKAAVAKQYDDTKIEEEIQELTSFIQQSTDDVNLRQEETNSRLNTLKDNVSNLKIDFNTVWNFCTNVSTVHFESVGEEVLKALELRDTIRQKCQQLSSLLTTVTNKTKNKKKNKNTGSSESELRQLGSIASSLRSVVVPTLAEFRSTSDRAAGTASLRLARFGLQMKRQTEIINNNNNNNNNNDDDDEDGDNNEDTTTTTTTITKEQEDLQSLTNAVDSLQDSRKQVNTAVCDLSSSISEAWMICNENRVAQPQTPIPRPTTPAAQPLPVKQPVTQSPIQKKRKTKKTPGIGMREVQIVVDHALENLQIALREKASKIMVGVVQEQSLAQIDVLRDEMREIDAISRKSDLLQIALDDHAQDLSKIYDHLMSVARSGGETNEIVAELRLRIDQTTESVASIASDKARVDAMQHHLMSRTKDATKEARSTDQRLSHIMGSFMNKVEGTMSNVKRENGEAAHELKKRFSKELRGSMQRVSSKISSLENDVRMIHPLVNTDVARLGSTSLVLASRCMSCERPIWKTTSNTYDGISVSGDTYLPQTLKGAMQGSLLLAQTAPVPTTRTSESRGGGFRVGGNTMAPGAGLLWVGGSGSPTGSISPSRSRSSRGRPSSSMGFREKRY